MGVYLRLASGLLNDNMDKALSQNKDTLKDKGKNPNFNTSILTLT